MNIRGIPSIAEVEAEEWLKIKDDCEKKHGKGICITCPSVTANNWCRNHPDFESVEERTIH